MSSQEKVEFFNSQSSFGSQLSLASSRYYDLTNQIAEQTQTVLLTLKKEIQPTKQLTNFDKIQYLNNRAKIIVEDTIPQHILYLNKISSPKEPKQICYQCVQKLTKFIKDYESLGNGVMLQKQFYNIYGRSNENNIFFKKDLAGQTSYCMMEPDVIQINQPNINTSRGKTGRGHVSNVKVTKDLKELKQLQQQIVRVRKRENDMKKQFDKLLLQQKLNCEKRISGFLKNLNQKSSMPQPFQSQKDVYKNELILQQQSLRKSLQQKSELMKKINQLQSKLRHSEAINDQFREQIQGYRKLQNSRAEQSDQLNRSVHSEYGQDLKDTRKLNVQIKNLTSERDILRNQLSKYRENINLQKIRTDEDQSKQILRLKKLLQYRNEQNEELKRQFDRVRVEIIQLKQENKQLLKKINENNNEMRKQYRQNPYSNFDVYSVSTNLNVDNKTDKNIVNFRRSNVSSYNGLQTSIVGNIKPNSFDEYQGQGIQGYPYFELLSKQFKIRFKRSCLKTKQLLYKGDSIQIGIISQFSSPNVIKMFVHITNNGQQKLKNFKIKAMNPNDNKIECQVQQIAQISSYQQIKLPIACTIKNYPIGPVVLVLDYLGQTKHDIRLLLPVHIFKCVTIQNRDTGLIKPNKIEFNVDKKVCKNIEMLKQYFNCQDRFQNQIKVTIKHQHSNSSMYLDITMNKDQISLKYQHIKGMQRFTEYFIKTFKALMEKTK